MVIWIEEAIKKLDEQQNAPESCVSGQAFKAVPPVAPAEFAETPIASAIVPDCQIPDEPSEVEIDARIDRLLRENLKLLQERTALRENIKATQARSSKCLEEARHAKKLVREFLVSMQSSLLVSPEDLAAMQEWAAKPL